MVIGLAAGAIAAAVVVPGPAQSSVPGVPPVLPSFAGDIVSAPVGTPTTRAPRLVHEHGSTTYKRGTYDVHILAVASDAGPAPWDEARARRQVESLDAWFSSHTRGMYRFRLAGYQVIPAYPGQLCGVEPALEHAAPEIERIRPSSGATDALPVVVGAWPSGCAMAGQAWLGSPGAWVSEDATFPDFSLSALIHELGHNLGLEHSGAVDPVAGIADPWPAGTTPTVIEYGDGSDIMGQGIQWSCVPGSCDIRPTGLHAHNRNLLGALESTEIGFVGMASVESSVDVELVHVNAESAGTRAVYLPWLNRTKFMLEYRTASGGDVWLDSDGGAGSGVVARLVDTDLSSGPEPYPRDDDTSIYYGTVAWPVALPATSNDLIPLGLKVGKSTRLTDGTLVEVLSADAMRATVRVTRPADTTAPTMSIPKIEYAGGACTRYPCTVPAKASKKGKYRLLITFGSMDDNQWVVSAQVAVNGTPVFVDDRPAPDGTDEETSMSPGSRGWGGWRTYPAGRYTVTYRYTDLAGNEGSSSIQIILPRTVR